MNKKIAKLLAENDNTLLAYSFPGLYSIVYYDAEYGMICFNCANEMLDELVDYDVYWEGPTMQCVSCNCNIESEYGDPDEQE